MENQISKKIALFLIVTLMVFAGCGSPMRTTGLNDAEAPLNCHTIIVSTEMDAEAAYNKVLEVVQERGYAYRETDRDRQIIRTHFQGIHRREVTEFHGIYENTTRIDWTFARLEFSIRGNDNAEVEITGWISKIDSRSDQEGERITKFGPNNSPERLGWAEMFAAAEDIGGILDYQSR